LHRTRSAWVANLIVGRSQHRKYRVLWHTLFIIDEEVKEARRIAHGGKPHAEAVQDAMNQLVESEEKAERTAKSA